MSSALWNVPDILWVAAKEINQIALIGISSSKMASGLW